MKKAVKIVVIGVLALVVLGVIKNSIFQSVLTSVLSGAAHVPVRVGSVDLSFLSASIRLKNLQVHNPSGFPGRLMIDVPQVFIDFEPAELFQGRAHFKEVRLELKEMTVIRDKNGRLNVDAVKPTEQQKNEARQKAKTPPGHGGRPPKLLIDKLDLSIGRVVYKDYSAGKEPQIQTFDINIQHRVYNNIDNPSAVVSLIMFEALTRTTLSSLASLDVSAFKEGGLQALSKGLGVVTDGTDVVQNTTKQLLNLIK
jgi:uncharacterized protein involved in outer membrane biogenesis